MVSRKRSSAVTEEKILEAALKLFSEQGYAGTPTSQIAAEAEVSEGTIFKYFPKKMDLLRSVLYTFLDRYSTQIIISPLEKIFETHKGEHPKVLLKAIILDRIKMFDKMDIFLKVLMTEMQYHPELKDIFVERILLGAKDFGEMVFRYFHEQGYLRTLPPIIPIRNFMGAVGLMILQRKFAPETQTTSLSIEEEIDQVIDLFLYGIMKAGEKDE
jgi:AcrR family transcriptional regulator